jgi:hypothetical protein
VIQDPINRKIVRLSNIRLDLKKDLPESIKKALSYITLHQIEKYDNLFVFNVGMDLNCTFSNSENDSLNLFMFAIYDPDTDTHSYHI